MGYLKLFPTLFSWWYSKGLLDLVDFIKSIFIFTLSSFSIKTVIKTFFSPWKKMVEPRKAGLDGFRDWLVDNLVSRGVAIVLRLFLIVACLVVLVMVGLLSLVFFISWLIMPVILLAALIYLFKGKLPWL
jgi:Flp pilus assembly protein TadB